MSAPYPSRSRRVGRREDQRPGLDPDREIRRRDAARGEILEIGRGDEIEDRRRGAEFADHAVIAALATVHGDRAAQYRRDGVRRGEALRQRPACRLADPAARHELLRPRHVIDHAVIGFAGARPEGEDAVLVEDQRLDRWVLVEDRRGLLRQREARHDIVDEADPIAKGLAGEAAALGLVDHGQHGGRMGVVDEFCRKEGMQQRFDGTGWARRDRSGWRAVASPCPCPRAARTPAP